MRKCLFILYKKNVFPCIYQSSKKIQLVEVKLITNLKQFSYVLTLIPTNFKMNILIKKWLVS